MNLGIRVNVDNYQARARKNNVSLVAFKGATPLQVVKTDNSKISNEMIEAWRHIREMDARKDQSRFNGSNVVAAKVQFGQWVRSVGIKLNDDTIALFDRLIQKNNIQ